MPLALFISKLSDIKKIAIGCSASALAACLYGLAFPSWEGVELSPLAWFCLLPLLHASLLQVPLFRYCTLALAAGVLGSWIAGHWTFAYDGWFFGVLAVVWHGLIYAPPLWLYRWQAQLQGHRIALLALPFSWTAWECLAANYQPFFWGALGATQSNLTWLVQFADLASVWGVSFWLVALNACLAYFGCYGAKRKLANLCVVLCVAVLVPTGYGVWRQQTLGLQAGKSLEVALLQPAAQQEDGYKALIDLMQSMDRSQWDLVVWPESIFNGMPFHHPAFQEDFLRWGAPVLMGFIASRSDMQRPGFADPYAAAIVLTPQSLERIRKGPVRTLLEPHYRKQRMVPFAELQLVPDAWLLRWPWLKQYTPSRMRYEDKESALLAVTSRSGATHAVAPLICYEAVFPHLAAKAVRQGAQALFVLANDIHFGPTEAWQSAAFSRLRAIETRTPIARTSTSGVVGVLDAFGNWQRMDHSRQLGVYPATLEMPARQPTLYVRWGDWFPRLCGFVWVGVWAFGCARSRRSKSASPHLRGESSHGGCQSLM